LEIDHKHLRKVKNIYFNISTGCGDNKLNQKKARWDGIKTDMPHLTVKIFAAATNRTRKTNKN
jgi:hypothetical protein